MHTREDRITIAAYAIFMTARRRDKITARELITRASHLAGENIDVDAALADIGIGADEKIWPMPAA